MAEQASRITPEQVLDSNGDPVSGALAYFYITGTTTLETVYTDSTLTTAHPSPLVADAGGFFAEVYHAADHGIKVVVTDSLGGSLYTLDPIPMTASLAAASGITFSPVAGNTATDVQQAIENNTDAAAENSDARDNQNTIIDTAGSGNAYTASANTTITAYEAGQLFFIRFDRANTGSATLDIDSLGAVNLRKTNNSGGYSNLTADDILDYEVYRVLYDGTRFVLLDERATNDRKGVVRKSTNAENIAGTEDKAYPSVLGVTTIIDNHMRAWAYESGEQTITASSTLSLAHGLGAAPSRIVFKLRCKTAEHNWAVGDEIILSSGLDDVGAAARGLVAYVDSGDTTNLKIIYPDFLIVQDKSTYARASLTVGNWRLLVFANL